MMFENDIALGLRKISHNYEFLPEIHSYVCEIFLSPNAMMMMIIAMIIIIALGLRKISHNYEFLLCVLEQQFCSQTTKMRSRTQAEIKKFSKFD